MTVELPRIKSIIILDSDGNRIAVKYFGENLTQAQQLAFEKNLFNKTQKMSARSDPEIILIDSTICVFKFRNDVHFYVTASADENDLLISQVLTTLIDSLSGVVGDKRSLIDNLDLVLLTIDELVDDGLILETSSANIQASLSALKSGENDIPLAEQTLSQAFAGIRKQVTESLLK